MDLAYFDVSNGIQLDFPYRNCTKSGDLVNDLGERNSIKLSITSRVSSFLKCGLLPELRIPPGGCSYKRGSLGDTPTSDQWLYHVIT